MYSALGLDGSGHLRHPQYQKDTGCFDRHPGFGAELGELGSYHMCPALSSEVTFVSLCPLPIGSGTRIACIALKFIIYMVPTKASLFDAERPDNLDMSLAWDVS